MGYRMNQTRQTLIARIQDLNDDHAWEEFTSQYQRYIHAVILKLKTPTADADDLVQRVLLILWKKLPEFEYRPGECKFRSWMNNITRKEVQFYFRTRMRYDRKLNKAHETSAVLEESQTLPDIEAISEREWKLHISNLAWENIQDSFTGKALECFELYKQGVDFDDIAQRLEITKKSAQVLKNRVVDKLCLEIRNLDEQLG